MPRKLPHSHSLGSHRSLGPGATCWIQCHTAPTAPRPGSPRLGAGSILCPRSCSPRNISIIKDPSSFSSLDIARDQRQGKELEAPQTTGRGGSYVLPHRRTEDRGAGLAGSEGSPFPWTDFPKSSPQCRHTLCSPPARFAQGGSGGREEVKVGGGSDVRGLSEVHTPCWFPPASQQLCSVVSLLLTSLFFPGEHLPTPFDSLSDHPASKGALGRSRRPL